ncbi:hypothetical protein PP175_28415 (plasmid) [Aneurinibacillus sp. Ricciae_BoGa-3]|uniref:hypothetical protein n=1 Tax=Aneurinibacillus sp. Ricciae_BoGa-3 TaxID=3022697 RepID=UPI00233FC8DE|nr:hypothetical protein [Aneurinibacillus sp. Ricciae_BoGa-3]WCK57116.1 hypothetical protein PP175_28415 [Aneurinibacillus sp. Ricciae_BoGa-3]
MRGYKEYITNIAEFENVNLFHTSGILKFSIQDEDYITYGKSIAHNIVSLIGRLEENKMVNQQFLDMYQQWGDSALSVTILEIGNYDTLREKSKEYIEALKPSLNYQRSGVKDDGKCYSKEHRQHMSESKKGEKHNLAKLSEEKALKVKRLALYSKLTSAEIGNMFGISAGHVRKIKNGLAWSHLKVS